MGKLNAPREIPYDFHTVEFDEIIYLFDNSVDTYICSQVKHVFLEPICSSDREELGSNIGDYWTRKTVEEFKLIPLKMEDEDITSDVEDWRAWESARDAARQELM